MAGSRWNGSSFVSLDTTRKRWNGSAWVDLTIAKRWTGTVWVDLFPAPPGTGPGLPTGSFTGGASATGYYDCTYETYLPVNPCELLHTFTLTKAFTTTGSPTVTGKPVAGVSYTIVGNNVTFSASVERGVLNQEFRPVLLLTNGSGTVELPFSWVLSYDYGTYTVPPGNELP